MNVLKLYFRSLIRHKVFSVITIGSFAVSLAVVVVLASFLASEFGYDKHITDVERIFRVAGPDNEAGIREEACQLLLDKLPEIESATNYMISGEPVVYGESTFNDDLEHANIKLIRLLVWLTVILLFLAVFNYVNLSIAQSLTRLREFGMKKVLGLGRLSLTLQFMKEAFITVLISLGISVYLGIFIKPVFENMFDKAIYIHDLLSSPVIILSGIVILIVISVVPALYPARIALRVKAGDLMSRRMSGKSGGYNFRKTLNEIQFAASIAIIVSLLVISRQVEYVKSKDFGFSTDQLVRIPVHWQAGDKVGVLIDMINTIPGVVDACYSHGTPGGIHNYSAGGEFERVDVITSDHRFSTTFGIPVVEGRNFYPAEGKEACLINRKAMRVAGWETFEGKSMFGYEVIGIIDDFHYQNMNSHSSFMMNTLEECTGRKRVGHPL